jgi:NAD(P)-dependent dehydrogenase (short-subunit alcohol dehydrogenase family)
MELRGRWALVTGAAKRIGRVVALELAGLGMNVVVHYNSSAADAEATVTELRARGVQAVSLRADLADVAQVRGLAEDADAQTGGIALLVNSASNYIRRSFDEISEADWDASLDVNLKAPFLLAWTIGRAMRTRGEGCIINVTDWAGDRPYRQYLPYCVSKGGLITLTKALAKELAPAVRVNAVSPGPVMPPDEFGPDELAAIRRATPLARIGTPEDVARAIRFLAEEADFSTGSVLHVDGGRGIA